MSISFRKQYSAFLSSFFVVLASVTLLIPQPVLAEPLLYLFKNDTGTTTKWQDSIHQKTKRLSTLGVNKNGDLVVKCGGMNVVLAYNQPEDPLKLPEPVRHAMAINQDQNAPPINGVSVSLNFTF